MADAPRKYLLINEKQLEAARPHWAQITDKTFVLPVRRSDEPMRLNKPPHKGVGFYDVPAISADWINGMFYRKDLDVLFVVSD